MITPITRKELYLAKIIGEDVDIPETAKTREELFFLKILDNFSKIPEPITREELFLAKISGQDVELPEPKTRLELFLAKAAGVEIETPTPITREEIFWSNYSAIIDFEVEGIPPLTFQSNGTALKNYRIYGNTVNGESVGDKTKNLLQYPFIFEDNREVNGITYTVNSDKSITVSGSFSGTTRSYYAFSPWWTNNTYNRIPLSAGQTVTFSCRGLPDDWEMIIGFCQSQTGTFDRIGSNVYVIGDNTYTYTADENCFIAFGIYQVTVSSQPGFTCYPQIEIGSIATEYEPYGCKVPVTVSNGADTQTIPIYLTEQIKKVGDEAEYIDYGEQKQHRVRKNELKNAATSQSINGLTFMVNTDKSITVNGTATETTRLLLGRIRLIKNVPYKISGCPSGGSTNTYRLDPRYTTGGVLIPFIDTGNGSVYTSENDIDLNIYIYVQNGYICDNLTFYPMIRKADIEDDTYDPYITNTELDVTLPALPVLSGTNTLTVGTEVQPSKVYIKGQKERD